MSLAHRFSKLVLALFLVLGLAAVTSVGGEVPSNRAEAMTLQTVPGTFVSAITVLNPKTNSSAANVSVLFYDQGGNLITTVNAPSPVPPGGTFFQYVPNISGLQSGVYSAVVQSDQQVYATVNLNTLAGTTPEMGESYNGTLAAAPQAYVPSVLRNYFGFTSTVTVQNAGGSAANVTVNIVGTGSNGAVNYTTPAQTIKPNASYTWDLASIANLGDNFNGAATVNGGGQNVAVISNTYTPNTSSTQPNYLFSSGNGFSAGSTKAYVPGLYKYYYGFYSALLIQNVDPSGPANVTVKYSNGATDSVTNLAYGASKLFFTPNNPGLPNGWQGSATITSTNGKKILATVNVQGTPGTPSGVGLASYSGFSAGSNTVFAPGLLKSYHGFNTALTIQNVDSVPATITVTYSNGASDPPATLQPGQSKLYYQPNESVLPAGFNGGATVVSTGGKIVGLINIQGDPAADQLFSTNAFGS